MRKLASIQIFMILLFVFSCSPEKQQGVQQPSSNNNVIAYKLEIQPLKATRETTLYIKSKDIDLSKTKVQWFVNSMPVKGATAPQFRLSEIKKGDSVQVKAIANNQEVASNQIIIKNSLPMIVRAKIVPPVPKANDILKVDVISNDRDGNEVLFMYEWSKNGQHAGSRESLEGPFKRGDKISMKITPYDGEDYGQPIILVSNIYNSPPIVSKDLEQGLDGSVYTTRINARDPDGDTLIYTIKQGPKGMTIDSNGVITWKINPEDKGEQSVVVSVSDGQGGGVLVPFTTTIRFAETL